MRERRMTHPDGTPAVMVQRAATVDEAARC
jgi:hypothetical protein